MGSHLKYNLIFLVLLTTICAIQATSIVRSKYNAIELGQSINGKTVTEFTTRSKVHCSIRCFTAIECDTYHYKGTGPGNCILIHGNSDGVGRIVTSVVNKTIYQKVWALPLSSWNQPSGWTGPQPANYWSFDILDGLNLMQGNEKAYFDTIVSGKRNCAIFMNRRKRQWADLGAQKEAYITRPEICGAAGGAVVFWMRVINYDGGYWGIISSTTQGATGFRIYTTNKISAVLHVMDGYFYAEGGEISSDWTHVVLNYIGPDDGQGISIYQDGVRTGSDVKASGGPSSPGQGMVVVGREFTDRDEKYSSVALDELLFFNQTLNDQQILDLKNAL